MPKHVRGNVLEEAAAPAVFFHQHPEGNSIKRLAGARDEEAITLALVQLWPAVEKIMRDRLTGGPANRHHALFHPLAQDAHAANLQVHITGFYIAKLRG